MHNVFPFSRTKMLFLNLVFVSALVSVANCLECYVCDQQDDNSGKCKQTIQTCEQEHDMCLTEIVWGTIPFWSQGAQKQYFVSKQCATKQQCAKTRNRFMATCSHIWYEDWKCADCCAGDRCNYYAIMGAASTRSNIYLMGIGLLFIIGGWRLL
ncbi:uncharacterized protein LOC111054121 [Nilaparvata lugens]|uniref:uncharacterized protein LOC111054121 n=1 Tax=Nilaparvata lugens TaxID=108931 RepID=UPI00193E61E9|nr:uncharacterized protein LOC111054121 [Nilaparvata lugens]